MNDEDREDILIIGIIFFAIVLLIAYINALVDKLS